MLNIVMPMAGRGKRFKEEGFAIPKPLIPIHGIPMTRVVISNLTPQMPHRFIFIILREHAKEFGFDAHLQSWVPGCEIVFVDEITEGAACTVLLAEKQIDPDQPLMIANCDQWVDVSIDKYLETIEEKDADGLIMTMWADHPKWSYIRFGPDGRVAGLVEKEVVSNEATVGIYNFRRGGDFIRSARSMIGKNLRVNNEFYVAPAFNELIAEGSAITIFNVGKEYEGMYGLGTPFDLKWFIDNEISSKSILI